MWKVYCIWAYFRSMLVTYTVSDGKHMTTMHLLRSAMAYKCATPIMRKGHGASKAGPGSGAGYIKNNT